MATSVSFEQIEPVLDELGWAWYENHGERGWYRYAWNVLEPAGLTAADNDEAHNEAAVHAVALWAITRTFFAKAFDEGHQDDWRYVVSTVIGDQPLIDAAWLVGKLAKVYEIAPLQSESDQDGKDVDEPEVHIDLEDEGGQDLFQKLIIDVAETINTHLSALGEATLFASLWAARSSGSEFPLPQSAIEMIFDNSQWSMGDAYGWVGGGMSIY